MEMARTVAATAAVAAVTAAAVGTLGFVHALCLHSEPDCLPVTGSHCDPLDFCTLLYTPDGLRPVPF